MLSIIYNKKVGKEKIRKINFVFVLAYIWFDREDYIFLPVWEGKCCRHYVLFKLTKPHIPMVNWYQSNQSHSLHLSRVRLLLLYVCLKHPSHTGLLQVLQKIFKLRLKPQWRQKSLLSSEYVVSKPLIVSLNRLGLQSPVNLFLVIIACTNWQTKTPQLNKSCWKSCSKSFISQSFSLVFLSKMFNNFLQ